MNDIKPQRENFISAQINRIENATKRNWTADLVRRYEEAVK